jgi:hypothetical protein
MAVIGLTTTHAPQDLKTPHVVRDLADVSAVVDQDGGIQLLLHGGTFQKDASDFTNGNSA